VSKYSDLMPSDAIERGASNGGLILAEDYVHDTLYLARRTRCVLYVVCATVVLAPIKFLPLAMQVIAFCTADVPKTYSVPKLICAVFAGEILSFLIFCFFVIDLISSPDNYFAFIIGILAPSILNRFETLNSGSEMCRGWRAS